jgi:uncharacterized protein VirK/YbjX
MHLEPMFSEIKMDPKTTIRENSEYNPEPNFYKRIFQISENRAKFVLRPLYRMFVTQVRLLEDWVDTVVVMQALNHSIINCVILRFPDTLNRFKSSYLSHSFSRRDRLRSMINHYRFIDNNFNFYSTINIMNNEYVLWEKIKDVNRYSISFTYDTHYWEGDLSLIFKQNDVLLYTLAFAVIPGRVVDMRTNNVLFISRLQGGGNLRGRGNYYELIRSSIKAFSGIRPTTVLLAAARAISTALGITCIAGVRTKYQLGFGSKWLHCGEMFNYDQFWAESGGQIFNSEQVFILPINPHHAPLRSRNRARKMQQYQFEGDLIREIQDTFERVVSLYQAPSFSFVAADSSTSIVT